MDRREEESDARSQRREAAEELTHWTEGGCCPIGQYPEGGQERSAEQRAAPTYGRQKQPMLPIARKPAACGTLRPTSALKRRKTIDGLNGAGLPLAPLFCRFEAESLGALRGRASCSVVTLDNGFARSNSRRPGSPRVRSCRTMSRNTSSASVSISRKDSWPVVRKSLPSGKSSTAPVFLACSCGRSQSKEALIDGRGRPRPLSTIVSNCSG